ncbi:MAG: hypothetical protein DSM106950_15100 [Stigonema ocellatum SAG 48.90 = DSM 106950]|nr:hypothetical protein [Stigonema ocellatum SAG 48.90 = DSM 106950]
MHYSVENIQAQTSNLWEELTDTQCQAVNGGVLLNGVRPPYFSVTTYPKAAGGGTIGVVANFPAPGHAYRP